MWTEEQISILTKLWHRGESSRIIALQLGTTRNAVIGKANRLGLPSHPSRADENSDQQEYEDNNVEELYTPKICS